MIFRQLFDPATSTYTYLLGDPIRREAVLVDPVREQVDRDARLVAELGLTLVATLETHVHADHVTGAALLRARLGSRIGVSRDAGTTGADLLLAHGDAVEFGRMALEVRATPGHTNGCLTYVTQDCRMAFTGDALLIRGCGRTDFQQGDARRLYRSVHDQIFSLPDDTLLYPGHDYRGHTVTTVREEKLYNPRLGGGRTEDAFVALMADLKLAPPRLIHEAVPANLRLGLGEGEDPSRPSDAARWAPVTRSATGAPRIAAEWVADHPGAALLLDVREPEEWHGELGRIGGARSVPLGTLDAAVAPLDRDAPLILVCRSGGRSDRAARLLEERGFTRVASLAGGMLRWNDLGLPIETDAPSAPPPATR